MRRTLTVIAAVLTLGAAVPSVAQAASDPGLCKSGGYANYIDPATNAPFKNQGQCVSFVDGGGMLTPVTPPASFDFGGVIDSAPSYDPYKEACLPSIGPVTDLTDPDPNEWHTYQWFIDGEPADQVRETLLPQNFGSPEVPYNSQFWLVVDGEKSPTYVPAPGCRETLVLP